MPLCNTHLLSFVNSTAVQFAIPSFLQDTTPLDGCGFLRTKSRRRLQLTAGSREIRIDLVYRFVFSALKSACLRFMTIDAIFKASCDGPARQVKFSISYQYTCCTIITCSFMDCFPVTKEHHIAASHRRDPLKFESHRADDRGHHRLPRSAKPVSTVPDGQLALNAPVLCEMIKGT